MNYLAMLVPSGFLLSADAFDINTKLDINEKISPNLRLKHLFTERNC